MTLGRTSSGAIKIKTDGGLRAVGCACCVGGGCLDCADISGAKIPISNQFANAILAATNYSLQATVTEGYNGDGGSGGGTSIFNTNGDMYGACEFIFNSPNEYICEGFGGLYNNAFFSIAFHICNQGDQYELYYAGAARRPAIYTDMFGTTECFSLGMSFPSDWYYNSPYPDQIGIVTLLAGGQSFQINVWGINRGGFQQACNATITLT